MTSGSTLAILPGSKPQQRVEVVLGQKADGGLSFELREQHYAEGIGWFDQRSLALDPSQIRQLRQVLSAGSVADQIIEEAAAEVPATLPFPAPGQARPRRTAIGDQG